MWSSDLFQAHPRNTGGGSAGPRGLCWRTNQVAVKDDIQRDSLPSPSQNVTFILSCLQRSSRELLNIVQKATDNRSKARSVCEEAAQPLAESSCSRGTPEELTQAACEKLTHLECQSMKASNKAGGGGEGMPIRDWWKRRSHGYNFISLWIHDSCSQWNRDIWFRFTSLSVSALKKENIVQNFQES